MSEKKTDRKFFVSYTWTSETWNANSYGFGNVVMAVEGSVLKHGEITQQMTEEFATWIKANTSVRGATSIVILNIVPLVG